MNKCTLLIDGNWLLQSRSSVMIKKFSISNSVDDRNIAKELLKDLLAKSISAAIYKLGVVDNIIFVTDSRSWRKSIDKPECVDFDYKGTRKKDSEIDFNTIFSALHELEDSLLKYGVTVSNSYGAEGDDAIWWWSRNLNSSGINTIIWTSDNDLKQLVNFNGYSWTVWYNDRSGIFANSNMLYDNEVDFFMRDSQYIDSYDFFKRLCREVGLEVFYINPEDIVMEKIICGDKSDNIKSIVRKRVGKIERKVTPKMWNEIKDELCLKNINNFLESRDIIIDKLLLSKRFTDVDRSVVESLLDYNTKLVWLDESQIPSTICESLSKIEYKCINIDDIKSNYKLLLCIDNKAIEDLFEF